MKMKLVEPFAEHAHIVIAQNAGTIIPTSAFLSRGIVTAAWQSINPISLCSLIPESGSTRRGEFHQSSPIGLGQFGLEQRSEQTYLSMR